MKLTIKRLVGNVYKYEWTLRDEGVYEMGHTQTKIGCYFHARKKLKKRLKAQKAYQKGEAVSIYDLNRGVFKNKPL